jgi:hypothetical protein
VSSRLIPAPPPGSPADAARREAARQGVEAITRAVEEEYIQRAGRGRWYDPYVRDGLHSYFRDLLTDADADSRTRRALDSPILRGRDPGPTEPPPAALRDDTLRAAKRRLGTLSRRDLSSSSVADASARPCRDGSLTCTATPHARLAGSRTRSSAGSSSRGRLMSARGCRGS